MPAKKPTNMPRKVLPKKERTRLRETMASKPITRIRGSTKIIYTPKGRKLLTRYPKLLEAFRELAELGEPRKNLGRKEVLKHKGISIRQLSAPKEAGQQRVAGGIHSKIFQITLPNNRMLAVKQTRYATSEPWASHELKKKGIRANDYYAVAETSQKTFILSEYRTLPTLEDFLRKRQKASKKILRELEEEKEEKKHMRGLNKTNVGDIDNPENIFVDLSAPKGKRLMFFDAIVIEFY